MEYLGNIQPEMIAHMEILCSEEKKIVPAAFAKLQYFFAREEPKPSTARLLISKNDRGLKSIKQDNFYPTGSKFGVLRALEWEW